MLATIQKITNPKMASDLIVGAALAKAAITGALANVEINLESLEDSSFAAATRKRMAELV